MLGKMSPVALNVRRIYVLDTAVTQRKISNKYSTNISLDTAAQNIYLACANAMFFFLVCC